MGDKKWVEWTCIRGNGEATQNVILRPHYREEHNNYDYFATGLNGFLNIGDIARHARK